MLAALHQLLLLFPEHHISVDVKLQLRARGH